MARINLLPWRAEQRERKNKEFLTVVAMIAVLAAAAAFSTWFFFNTEYKEQQKANALITSENAKLDTALKEIEKLELIREEMISRMKVIQDLQGKRPLPVLVWDDLARVIPETLYLTELTKTEDTIIIKGQADNPNIVSELITNLDNSKWMEKSAVNTIDEKTSVKKEGEMVYPEDEYIEFEVRTNIVANVTAEDFIDSATDNEVEETTEDQDVQDVQEGNSPDSSANDKAAIEAPMKENQDSTVDENSENLTESTNEAGEK